VYGDFSFHTILFHVSFRIIWTDKRAGLSYVMAMSVFTGRNVPETMPQNLGGRPVETNDR